MSDHLATTLFLVIFSFKWFIPFTYSIEKIGSVNVNTMSLNANNLWQMVTWFLPNETFSSKII